MASVGIKLLMRKDTGAFQIIGLVPGGPAAQSGMVQENDTLCKVPFSLLLRENSLSLVLFFLARSPARCSHHCYLPRHNHTHATV